MKVRGSRVEKTAGLLSFLVTTSHLLFKIEGKHEVHQCIITGYTLRTLLQRVRARLLTLGMGSNVVNVASLGPWFNQLGSLGSSLQS